MGLVMFVFPQEILEIGFSLHFKKKLSEDAKILVSYSMYYQGLLDTWTARSPWTKNIPALYKYYPFHVE